MDPAKEHAPKSEQPCH